MPPLVSVIIPNYNHGTFLKKRIESVLQQDFTDFELILLDDHSADNSAEIFQQYQSNPHVSHLIVNKENSGSTFRQWQKGIGLSRGKYIWIAESDDYCERGFLSTLIPVLENDPDISIAFAQSVIVDEYGANSDFQGQTSYPNSNLNPLFEGDFVLGGQEAIEQLMAVRNYIPNASAVVFRREKIDRPCLNEAAQMKLYGDWYFWISLLLSGNLYYRNELLNSFRTHPKTVRNQESESFQTLLDHFRIARLLIQHNKRLRKKVLDILIYKYLQFRKKGNVLGFKNSLRVHRSFMGLTPFYFIPLFKSIVRR